jgi:hypothetical protein
MKIVKIDGANKTYEFSNGDLVPFDELRQYVKKKHHISLPDKPKKKRRALKKLKDIKED